MLLVDLYLVHCYNSLIVAEGRSSTVEYFSYFKLVTC